MTKFNMAFRGIMEAREQAGERSFSCPARTDQGHHFPFLNREVEVALRARPVEVERDRSTAIEVQRIGPIRGVMFTLLR